MGPFWSDFGPFLGRSGVILGNFGIILAILWGQSVLASILGLISSLRVVFSSFLALPLSCLFAFLMASQTKALSTLLC